MSVGTRKAVLSLYKEALRVCSRFDDPLVKRKVVLECAFKGVDAVECERGVCHQQAGEG